MLAKIRPELRSQPSLDLRGLGLGIYYFGVLVEVWLYTPP